MPTDTAADDYTVIVCDACLTASCWHGEHMCQESPGAGIRHLSASTLRRLAFEHPSNYSRAKLREVYGEAVP